jgi:hypothetical protein
MLILLAGIRIAAIIGERIPCTAKDKPTILYKIESIKLASTMFLPAFA